MLYQIEVSDLAEAELRAIRVFDRRRIVDAIREQLQHVPGTATRNRKCLKSVIPRFEHVAPIWELRGGEFRVFYDVADVNQTVYVRAVRRKGQGQVTENIL